jgi:hypothetical protein
MLAPAGCGQRPQVFVTERSALVGVPAGSDVASRKRHRGVPAQIASDLEALCSRKIGR